jgi:hypothetical protein
LLQRSMPHVQIVVANFFAGIIMFAKKSDCPFVLTYNCFCILLF